MSTLELEGRRALVTGGTKGLGEAVLHPPRTAANTGELPVCNDWRVAVAYLDQKDADASQLEAGKEASGTGVDLILHPIHIDTASDDQQGELVFADGKLVAVLVRLASEAHGDDRDSWFAEAGFGPCDPPAKHVFVTRDEATGWIRERIAKRTARACDASSRPHGHGPRDVQHPISHSLAAPSTRLTGRAAGTPPSSPPRHSSAVSEACRQATGDHCQLANMNVETAAFVGTARALQSLATPPTDDQFAALLTRLDAAELAVGAIPFEMTAQAPHRPARRPRPKPQQRRLPDIRASRAVHQRKFARRLFQRSSSSQVPACSWAAVHEL